MTSPKRLVLIVDDLPENLQVLAGLLTGEGYEILAATNGPRALALVRNRKPDLILLDIMMPEMSGYDFIKAYRKESETPIILLTAKLDETDKVLGLELGADDYVTKPFGMKELTARIHAVLRRALRTPLEPDTLKIGSIHLDKDSRTVTVDGDPASLTPSEFDLLYVFMSAPGKVFSRSDLLLKLQGTAFEGVERTIDVHIRNLRTKIEQDPSNPQYIQTVFGIGYKFTSD